MQGKNFIWYKTSVYLINSSANGFINTPSEFLLKVIEEIVFHRELELWIMLLPQIIERLWCVLSEKIMCKDVAFPGNIFLIQNKEKF